MEYGDPWTPEQRKLIDIVLDAWLEHGKWPRYAYVADELERVGVHDAAEVLTSFPLLGVRSPVSRTYSDVVFDHSIGGPREDSEVSLTVGALARHPRGLPVARAFVTVLSYAAERRAAARSGPTEVVQVTVTSDDVARDLADPNLTSEIVAAVGRLLWTESVGGIEGRSFLPDDVSWSVSVSRDIREYAGLTLERYLELKDAETRPRPGGPTSVWAVPRAAAPVGGTVTSVQRMNPARAIEQLKVLREDAARDEVRRSGPAHDEWKAKVRVVMQRALGDDSSVLESFNRTRYHLGVYTGAPGEAEEDRRFFAGKVESAAALIDAAIYELGLDVDPEAAAGESAAVAPGLGTIFVVHGHDPALKESVARLLERTTSENVVVLHEQPDEGRTIIEKFEDHADVTVFAVVLLTPDDEGRAAGDDGLSARARQNVIFELGYFIGRLGRPRVVALYKHGVELPSDLSGLLYRAVDEGGAWRWDLLKELRAAGIEVDMNKA